MERVVEERLDLEASNIAAEKLERKEQSLRRELQRKDDDLQRKLQEKDDDFQRSIAVAHDHAQRREKQFKDKWEANEKRWWTWHQEEVARELLEYQQDNDLTEQQRQDIRHADENRILDSKGLMVLESPTAKA